ncbi:uncharacterized protein E0L32_002666 [Thyridium curvatum]|uniref:Cytochrome P450 n=1 Tax=Thyridium curvatum TaxID=1093900 RepID=A0A507BDY2_9PEZI|nr:uncharacterized protein E0L32_002666 [Thyridium curvatum]TPX18157.1 hypothetical protein E0L32_002666 [Thyridium curvatum]
MGEDTTAQMARAAADSGRQLDVLGVRLGALHIGVLLGVLLVLQVAGRKWWRYRGHVWRMKRLGKPTPAWNPFLGNMIAAAKMVNALPPKAHSTYIVNGVGKTIKHNGAFYLDLWPMTEPLLVVTDPDMATQATTHPITGARKPAVLKAWFLPITGGPSLFDSNDAAWKYLHNLFTPGFSANNIANEVPVIASKISVYRDLLRHRAREGGRFEMEPMTLSLIIDIIGEVVLNVSLDTQHARHPLADAMIRQLALKFSNYAPQKMMERLSPLYLYGNWRNSRDLDSHIRAQVESRFRSYRAAEATGRAERYRSVMDLAIEDYMSQPGKRGAAALDAEFMTMAVRNMRMFFFAGYDSSAATIVFCYHNIYRHPEVLARIRAEHDAVFGTGLGDDGRDDVPAQIERDPALLNALPYTLAVIKETMRLFPPAQGIREGSRELELVDAQGQKYPTEGISVLISHYGTHRNPRAWVRPHDFLPERWLVAPGHELYPPRGAWRPFEQGPRLCVGQQLVFTEVKAVLACVVREFDVRDCYAEIDAERGRPAAAALDLSGVDGDRAYMVEAGAAHPVGSYPCRVSFSGYGGRSKEG